MPSQIVASDLYCDGVRLDEIDQRILHALKDDARTASATQTTEEVNVSLAMIRNRIVCLEDHGIVTGYHTTVIFERTDGWLTNLFLCNVPYPDIELVIAQAGTIPSYSRYWE